MGLFSLLILVLTLTQARAGIIFWGSSNSLEDCAALLSGDYHIFLQTSIHCPTACMPEPGVSIHFEVLGTLPNLCSSGSASPLFQTSSSSTMKFTNFIVGRGQFLSALEPLTVIVEDSFFESDGVLDPSPLFEMNRDGSLLVFTDVTVTNYTVDRLFVGKAFSFTNVLISRIHASNGLFPENVRQLNVTSSTFTDFHVGVLGGLLGNIQERAHLCSCSFRTVTGSLSMLRAIGSAVVTISSVSFTNFVGVSHIMDLSGSEAYLTDVTIEDCAATQTLVTASSSYVYMETVMVTNVTAGTAAFSFYLSPAVFITGCYFDFHSTSTGLFVSNVPATFSVTQSVFVGASDGALKVVSVGQAFVIDCTFEACHGVNGGAISASYFNDFVLTNNTFTNNTATIKGGAVSFVATGGAAKGVYLNTNIFSGNSAGAGGAALYIDDEGLTANLADNNFDSLPAIDDVMIEKVNTFNEKGSRLNQDDSPLVWHLVVNASPTSPISVACIVGGVNAVKCGLTSTIVIYDQLPTLLSMNCGLTGAGGPSCEESPDPDTGPSPPSPVPFTFICSIPAEDSTSSTESAVTTSSSSVSTSVSSTSIATTTTDTGATTSSMLSLILSFNSSSSSTFSSLSLSPSSSSEDEEIALERCEASGASSCKDCLAAARECRWCEKGSLCVSLNAGCSDDSSGLAECPLIGRLSTEAGIAVAGGTLALAAGTATGFFFALRLCMRRRRKASMTSKAPVVEMGAVGVAPSLAVVSDGSSPSASGGDEESEGVRGPTFESVADLRSVSPAFAGATYNSDPSLVRRDSVVDEKGIAPLLLNESSLSQAPVSYNEAHGDLISMRPVSSSITAPSLRLSNPPIDFGPSAPVVAPSDLETVRNDLRVSMARSNVADLETVVAVPH